jgi:aspartyl protease family protein
MFTRHYRRCGILRPGVHMLKAVLLLVGMAFAAAVMVPDLLDRVVTTKSGEKENLARAEQADPDHGGIVRLAADRNGHYSTDIEVNGRSVKALVDTGATLIALRYEDARSIGVVSPGDRFDVTIRTANGEGRAKRVRLRSVSLGSITLRDVDALVVEQGALSINLLGMSFLKRLARFEVQRGQLVLER